MKVLIIEDEQLAAKKLIRLLNETDTAIEVTAVVGSVEGAAMWLRSNAYPS